jgi:hypothetical protein
VMKGGEGEFFLRRNRALILRGRSGGQGCFPDLSSEVVLRIELNRKIGGSANLEAGSARRRECEEQESHGKQNHRA